MELCNGYTNRGLTKSVGNPFKLEFLYILSSFKFLTNLIVFHSHSQKVAQCFDLFDCKNSKYACLRSLKELLDFRSS